MKKIVITFLLLAIISGIYSILWTQQQESHPIDPAIQCRSCHNEGTDRNKYTGLKEDISSACIKCHVRGDANHGVNFTPQFKVPSDLPLSKSREITCITCHSPHNQRFSNRTWQAKSLIGKMGDMFKRGKHHKTYFLRRNNADGDLCFSCHKEREGE